MATAGVARAMPGSRYPFTLGVASGYPSADSVVLWTRLAPEPLAPDGGLAPLAIRVGWELARDEHFRQIERRGVAFADPAWAHSVRVEPEALPSGRPYWYRFHTDQATSPIGRCWTAPPPGQASAALRIQVACCQHYEQGFYNAYGNMVADNPDLILHLGDYIYEKNAPAGRLRLHGSGECVTLEDYRIRHALYRLDPQLQQAHAACPWLMTLDDHDVSNDYAGDVSEEDDDPAWFRARRAAAYRAYFEHLPLPSRAAPYGPDMRAYAIWSYGDLATLYLLDERQYRSPEACPRPGRAGSNRVDPRDCPQLLLPSRTMLGARQEAWLDARLAESQARWNLLAQGVVMAYANEAPSPRELYWTDGWNGYPAARERLLASVADRAVRNPVVLGGDIHAFLAADLRRQNADPTSPVVCSELVTTSISSHGASDELLARMQRGNPDLLGADGTHRGYLRLDLSAATLQADWVAVPTTHPGSVPAQVLQRYRLLDGLRGLQSER